MCLIAALIDSHRRVNKILISRPMRDSRGRDGSSIDCVGIWFVHGVLREYVIAASWVFLESVQVSAMRLAGLQIRV